MKEISAFKENSKLHTYLAELNNLLSAAEIEALRKKAHTPELPVVFVVGVPRSGVTLVMQWLAASGLFSYPSNLIARFYKAPYLGARIQRMLTDPELAYRDEMWLPGSEKDDFFISDLGKTRGLFAPNAFHTFWDDVLNNGQNTDYAYNEKNIGDAAHWLAELAAFESVLEKPLVFNGARLYRLLACFTEKIPHVFFIHVVRKPLYTMQSLYAARQRQYGTHRKWFPFKIPEYEQLASMSPYKQIAGQYHFMDRKIIQQLTDIPSTHYLTVHYEHFCRYPQSVWQEINKSFNHLGFTLHCDYNGPPRFSNKNRKHLAMTHLQRLAAAYFALSGKKIRV